MTLIEPYASRLRVLLAEHRRAAERAEQADELGAIKAALAAAWGARIAAYQTITEGERETLAAAVARTERKVA